MTFWFCYMNTNTYKITSKHFLTAWFKKKAKKCQVSSFTVSVRLHYLDMESVFHQCLALNFLSLLVSLMWLCGFLFW